MVRSVPTLPQEISPNVFCAEHITRKNQNLCDTFPADLKKLPQGSEVKICIVWNMMWSKAINNSLRTRFALKKVDFVIRELMQLVITRTETQAFVIQNVG